MSEEFKICTRCLLNKSIDNFYLKDFYKGKMRREKFCKSCRRIKKVKNSNIEDVISVNKNESDTVLKQVVKDDIGLSDIELKSLSDVVLKLKKWHQAMIADSAEQERCNI